MKRSYSRSRSLQTQSLFRRQLRYEILEARRVLATYVVDTTADAGATSLRGAIAQANLNPGPDVIQFAIPGAGVHVISPTSVLPDITDPITIDGTSQPGYATNNGKPLIEIDGSLIAPATNGLYVNTHDSLIKGLSIVRFTFAGMILNGDRNLVQSNFIGVHADGVTPGGNGSGGVWTYIGSDNVIGTDGDGVNDDKEGNVISGNTSTAVYMQDNSDRNVVAGNILGLDWTGTVAVGTQQFGVWIFNSLVDDARIGTNGDGISDQLERNVISGNTQYGIRVDGTHRAIIAGNLIGTNAAGTALIGTGQSGISLGVNVQFTRIGTNGDGIADDLERNVIVGGLGNITGNNYGIVLSGANNLSNVVAGNYIGVGADGSTPMPNGRGVWIQLGATDNTIGGTTAAERNIISGNAQQGVFIEDVGTTKNQVMGNYVGLDALGTHVVGNGSDGIAIANGASNNVIGGGGADKRNVVSGQTGPLAAGISIAGVGSSGNKIQGNYVGTDVSGTIPLGNIFGVFLVGGATNNFVGTDGDGLNDQAEGNLISGNTTGVWLSLGASDNIIAGNLIGTNASGTSPLPNTQSGIRIFDSSVKNNRIGTDGDGSSDAFERNVISGNTSFGVYDSGGEGTIIAGNYIGTDIHGIFPIAGQFNGIALQGSTKTRIGTQSNGLSNDAERNVISGNQSAGVEATTNSNDIRIAGNFIGTDFTALAPVAASANSLWLRAENTVKDSGSNQSVIATGNLTFGKGQEGNAFQFDGLTFLQTGKTINYSTGASLEAWFNSTSSSGGFLIGDGGGTTSERGMSLFVNNGVPQVYGSRGTNGVANFIVSNATSPALNDGKWHHLVATWDGTTAANGVKLFVDGTLADQTTALSTITTGSTPVFVGGHTLPVSKFVGAIDEASVFDRVLTSQEVQTIFAQGGRGVSIANQTGVSISNGSTNVRVGGTLENDRNIISGNLGYGVSVTGPTTSANTISGNFVGLNLPGTLAIGNESGIVVNGSANTILGGLTDGSGNVVSGNSGTVNGFSGAGVVVISAPTTKIQGNTIGLNAAGTDAVGNVNHGVFINGASSGLVVGGGASGSKNTIAGNRGSQIALQSDGVKVSGNYISTTKDGLRALNSVAGADIVVSANNDTIGTDGDGVSDDTEGNLIALVSTTLGAIYVAPGSSGTKIAGNALGVGLDGISRLGTTGRSAVYVASGSTNTRIGSDSNGTSDSFERNVIEGGTEFAILQQGTGTLIAGNYIGTNSSGTARLTQSGVTGISLSAGNATVGGTSDASRNVISGGFTEAIAISSNGPNLIQGNFIGTGKDGTGNIGNAIGISLTNSAGNSVVGGVSPNVIGNSSVAAIAVNHTIASSTFSNNLIGVDTLGNAIPNAYGIHVLPGNTAQTFAGNQVKYSSLDNILVESAGIVLTRNISDQATGAAIRLNPPTLAQGTINIIQVLTGQNPVVTGEIVGAAANSRYRVELFSSTSVNQASQFVFDALVDTDASGFASFTLSPGSINGYVNATFTKVDLTGPVQTSALSNSVLGSPVIINGLRSQSPEGTPITLTAFSSINEVNGYFWTVLKDGVPYTYELRNSGTLNEAGIQFTPDNQGIYTVSLRVRLNDTTQVQLGPFTTNVYNVAPTPSFDYSPSVISAGTPVLLKANNSDPGQLDILRTSWVVRSGSATGPIVFSTAPSTSDSATFTPSGGGLYYVTMTVDDGDGGVRSLTRTIDVNGLPTSATMVVPQPTAVEGQRVRVYAEESLLNRTEKLTFTWTLTKTPLVGASSPYLFTVPSSGVIEFTPDDDGVYTIGLTVSDSSGSVVASPKTVVVSNADPQVTIRSSSNTFVLNNSVTFTANVSDPGKADTQTVLWRVYRNNQATGETGTGLQFQYTPVVSGIYTIEAVATDDDFATTNPVGQGTSRRSFAINESAVSVSIVPPTGVTSNTIFQENSPYLFTSLVPAGVTSYAWRVRTSSGFVEATSAASSLNFQPLQGGQYQIELKVTLADGREGSAVFGPITVQGAAPTISSLEVVSPQPTIPPSPIFEGTPITVRAAAVDSREAVGLTYRWELKKPGQATYTSLSAVDGAPRDLRFVPDNQGVYSVHVVVVDSQGLSSESFLSISVENADPFVRLDAEYDSLHPNDITFVAVASDPGAADIPHLSYEWSLDNGLTFTSTGSSNRFPATLSTLTSILVRVTDGEGGSATVSYRVVQGTNGDDTINADSSAIAEDQLLVLGLDGNDTINVIGNKKVLAIGGAGNDSIDAHLVTANVLLDGGDGNDHLIAGDGNDVLIAGTGNNVLVGGNGNNRFIGGGSDDMTGGINSDYYDIHFSKVVLHDSGGIDTIDLTRAQAGIKLDLSTLVTDQPVFANSLPTNSTEPYAGSTLALNGSFENLIGSTYADELSTGTAGTSIDGGTGNDTLSSSAPNTTLIGGQGNDVITFTGGSGTVDGGAGNDTVKGTLSPSSTTQISTGEGADIVDIAGASTTLLANVSIALGGGTNKLTVKNVTGTIFSNNGSQDSASQAFGVSNPSASTIDAVNASTVKIFGGSTPDSTVNVTGGSTVAIFGAGNLTLNNVTDGLITSTLFGVDAPAPVSTLATVTNSSNVKIFGNATGTDTGLSATVTNASNVKIFGTPVPSGPIDVTGGSNVAIYGLTSGSVSLNGVTGTDNTIELGLFGGQVPSSSSVTLSVIQTSNVSIFGVSSPIGPSISGSVTNSDNVKIFGADGPVGSLMVTGGSNVKIFGLTGGDITLDHVTDGTVVGSQFGSAETPTSTLTVTSLGSSNVKIFGSSSPTGPDLTATVIAGSNVKIFSGDGPGLTTVVVTGVDDVGIFGSSTPQGSSLGATVVNSSNVKIFGSATANDTVNVTGGGNVKIYGMLGGDVQLNSVIDAEVQASDFGIATTSTVTVEATGSQNVKIFGSSTSTGPTISATVINTSTVKIFGSATNGNTMDITGGSNVKIYGSYGDQVTLTGVQQAYVEEGVFGIATSNQGLGVTLGGGSSNVIIYGSSLDDTVRVGLSSQVGINLGAGKDEITIDGGSQLVAITDADRDRVTVKSGSDMLIYLGEGQDQAEVDGGSLVRIIGEAGDDGFLIAGGDNIQIDGGDGLDQVIATGGKGITVRGDADNDSVDLYGGVGFSVSGGAGNDQLRVIGSLGAGLDAGLVYALLDGQDGNDTLKVLPLFSVADRQLLAATVDNPAASIPTWMNVPAWITSPDTTTYASSIALVGGTQSDTLWLEGAYRLYGLGGDDADQITLQSGANSEISGGTGNDNIVVNASGSDNRVFGDQDDDTIRANDGVRLGIFGEEGSDSIRFFGGRDSFARGGLLVDTIDIFQGTRTTVVGESGDDILTIRGGTDGIAAGGIGSDTMEILGGDRGILLGQSGDDHLKATSGTHSVVSGGDGDDWIEAANRGDDLYGDDGDDKYQIQVATPSVLAQSQLLRLRELLYVDPNNFEPQSRGSDTIDLSGFVTSATLNLGTTGLFSSLTTGLQSVIAGQLQLILLGSLENIIGTEANDFLTGSSESNRLEGRGGADTLVGMAGNDTLEGGTGNDILDGGTGDDLYTFTTTSAVSLGSDTIYEGVNSGTDGLDLSGMPVGIGSLDLNVSTTQTIAPGLLSLTLKQSSTNGARGDLEEVVATPFNDALFGNELDNRFEPGAGNDTVDGRGGSDVYTFSGRNLGVDQIVESSTGTGRDTLDFAGLDSPLNLDLASTSPQNLGELTLTLSSGDSIENVVGTSYDDVILGNTLNNALYGAAGADRLEGRDGNDQLVADLPSIVFLDFDSAYRADRGDYFYTTSDRNAIQQRLTAAYSAFNWVFTQYETTAPAGFRSAKDLSTDLGRNYVRLNFSQGRGGGVSGDAGEVDFRNINRRLVSEVNINALIPTVRQLLVQTVGVNYTQTDFANMVVALTSTIAAHELAHTAGLRHGDSFGPIGSGVYSGADMSATFPVYTGATLATETGKHIMASPASVGTTIADAAGVTYFGEREAIKLAFDEIGSTRRENGTAAGSHGSIATAENLGALAPLYVPNLATAGVRAGQSFKVSAMDVVGDLTPFSASTGTERDFYKFSAKAGEVVNIELLAAGFRPLRGTAFDGELRLYKSDGTQIAINDDDFEGTKDATLLDIPITVDGDYFVAVGLSPSPAILSSGGRYELFISRFAVGVASNVSGDTLVGGAGSDVLIGGAADDLFLASGALSTDVDTLDGKGGYDTLDKLGRSFVYSATSIENIVSTGNTPPTVAITGAVDGVMLSSTNFVFTATDVDSQDANGPFEFSIAWGDGTTNVVTSLPGQRTVSVAHTYATVSPSGVFAITATAKDARQAIGPLASKDFAVTGYTVMADPAHPLERILVVVGTQGADSILVKEADHDNLRIKIRDRESSLRIRGRVDGDVNHILVFALDGSDQVIIDDDVDVDAEIWGGKGNDYIASGEGNDLIWGGAGDDILFGGEGRDIMIGGTGADQIIGDDEDDILIGGLTAFDDEFNQQAPNAFASAQRLSLVAQRVAMESILAEWASSRSYAVRRNNILGIGTGTRLNGNNFLRVNDATLLGNTVFDDGALDKLWGQCGIDWFFANTDGDHNSAIDRVMDGTSSETRTDIDKWW